GVAPPRRISLQYCSSSLLARSLHPRRTAAREVLKQLQNGGSGDEIAGPAAKSAPDVKEAHGDRGLSRNYSDIAESM
ncbi:MAG: hypothetical protein ABR955_16530, partial [Verrucomicrobiota bacterium]